MPDRLTALFRDDANNFDTNQGPSTENPGGGLATKRRHLARALPNLTFVPNAESLGDVSIIDVLYFSGGGTEKTRDDRIKAYREHKGFKILWTSDFEIFRWLPVHREQIFDATDVIAGNSPYMKQLLEGYFDYKKVALLTDPIDTNTTQGEKKRNQSIYACSQIILEKGIDDVISLYKGLQTGTHAERSLQRVFIGSSSTWGVHIRDVDSFDLELKIEEICNDSIWSLPPIKVQEWANRSWIFVSFARFESFGYAMVEALLGGCHVFARHHLAYQDRIDAGVIKVVSNPMDARHHIRELIENSEPTQNEAGVQFVHDNYSFLVFVQ